MNPGPDIIMWSFATYFSGATISPLESASWLENECNTRNKANMEIKACLQIHIHLTELQQFSSKFIAHQSEEETVNLTGLRQTQHKQIKCKFLLLPALSGHPCSVHQHAVVFLPTLATADVAKS